MADNNNKLSFDQRQEGSKTIVSLKIGKTILEGILDRCHQTYIISIRIYIESAEYGYDYTWSHGSSQFPLDTLMGEVKTELRELAKNFK